LLKQYSNVTKGIEKKLDKVSVAFLLLKSMYSISPPNSFKNKAASPYLNAENKS
jgi:hypothetical protein